jgi:hypothetical protein
MFEILLAAVAGVSDESIPREVFSARDDTRAEADLRRFAQ